MKIPKRSKYKKYHKNKIKGTDFRSSSLQMGSYGLKAVENGRVSASQIETLRQTIGRKIRPRGRLWIRIFPYLPVTQKPSEVRMGKGKGAVKLWVCPVKRGQILYEVSGVSRDAAKIALKGAADKLPFKSRIITY